MADGTGTNRKAYLLAASAEMAAVRGRWRSVAREAFLTREEAEAAEEGFLGRCREAESDPLGPDPATLRCSVTALDLVDDLDADGTEVFLLAASGRDATFGGRFQSIGRALYASRARAEAELPAFLDRCADPGLGLTHAEREGLRGEVRALALAPRP